MGEMIIDAFAGGGGASVGIEMALGRPVDIAVNHDPDAILMHKTNHPNTVHLTEDIFKVDLKKYTKGQHVALMWASPDCTSHSKAKGGNIMINIVNSYDEKARELYKNCDIYYNRNIFIAKSIPSDNECIKSRLHSHNEYEFFIPNSPIPFLVNEDSIFFGEIGYIYTAKSNQKHGIKYNLSNIDYTSILIDTDYLKNIMQELKCTDNLFNHPIYLSRELKFYLHIFQD